MKKTLKYVPKASDVKPITLDAFRLAGFDLFELIVDMDKLMHAYGMPTIVQTKVVRYITQKM